MVNSTSCMGSFCVIPFCKSCGSVRTCSACITGFNLDATNETCTSHCPMAGFANCLFCSNTSCLVCDNGYVINSGQCILPCASIQNCIVCSSPITCAACSPGYSLSSSSTTCTQLCQVEGCLICPNATAPTCTTCKPAYSPFTDQNGNQKCSKNCA